MAGNAASASPRRACPRALISDVSSPQNIGAGAVRPPMSKASASPSMLTPSMPLPAPRRSLASWSRSHADIPSGQTKPLVARVAMPAIAMPSMSTKGSPSMIMRSAKVPAESPSSAFGDVFRGSAMVSITVFHLTPVGKPAPRGAQAGIGNGLTMSARNFDRAAGSPIEAAMRLAVVVERQRSWTPERDGQARLRSRGKDRPRDRRATVVAIAGEEMGRRTVTAHPGRHRTVGDRGRQVRLDLDQGLQETGAARTIATIFALQPARRNLGSDCAGDLVRAERQRARIAGDDRGGQMPHFRRRSLSLSSSSRLDRPRRQHRGGRAGAEAEAHRGFERDRAVLVVLVKRCEQLLELVAIASAPIDWQASRGIVSSTWRPAGAWR